MRAARIIRGGALSVASVDLPPVEALRAGGTEAAQLAAMLAEAERRGEERGRAAGRAEAEAVLAHERAELAERRALLAGLLEHLGAIGRDALEADAVEVIMLALELAQQVLATELVAPEERVATWVARVLAEEDASDVTVRVAPRVRASLESELAELGSQAGRAVRVEADDALGAYDVVVELGQGVLDLTVRGAFDRVLQELRELER